SRLARRRRRRSCRQQIDLRQALTADHQLTGKDSTFLDRNSARGDITIERTALVNYDDAFSDDLARHSAADFDALNMDAPEKLHVGFSLDQDVRSTETTGNFPSEIDCRRARAMQAASQLPFD